MNGLDAWPISRRVVKANPRFGRAVQNLPPREGCGPLKKLLPLNQRLA